jgi:S-adenosylmethionine:tRNA ribosyltransferase-isomerase
MPTLKDARALRTADFDYNLPDELIAQHPVEPRDQARLMVLRREAQTWEHRRFFELPELLEPGDVLVRNDTKVVPARLVGRRQSTGGRWEGLFLRALPDGRWELLTRTRGRPRPGETVRIEGGLSLQLDQPGAAGRWLARPVAEGTAHDLLQRFGQVPLPPYIRKGQEGPGDRERYQTLYARAPGAVAAPTAGLHFTAEVLSRLERRGIPCLDVTLHVGIGTFRPIEADQIEQHTLHSEWAEVSPGTATALEEARRGGARLVAVGTTTVRTLETAAQSGTIRPFSGETALYLKPGHTFRAIGGLITNFHLPRSSLLVLVSAFAGVEFIRAAYAEAIRRRYRFYSYGDAMLIV